MLLNDNSVSGVVKSYYYKLLKSGVITDNDNVLVEPNKEAVRKFNNKEKILIQQGINNFDDSNFTAENINKIFCCNFLVFNKIKSLKEETYLLEFPLEDNFKIEREWGEREDAIYYHGRIIPQKLPFEELKELDRSGIKVVLQGPVCKKYWTEKNEEKEEYVAYKSNLKTLKNIIFLEPAETRQEIVDNLNKYKFYFTFSNGEVFNVALQEAISCGTIPLVRDNAAYWWAEHSFFSIDVARDLIETFNYLKDVPLHFFSKSISERIIKNCSMEAICKKSKAGFWHNLWKNSDDIDFEIRDLVDNYSQYVETVMSCSGHHDGIGAFIAWKGWDQEFNKKVEKKFKKTKFKWFFFTIEDKGETLTKLTVVDEEGFFYINNNKYYYNNFELKEAVDLYFLLMRDFEVLKI